MSTDHVAVAELDLRRRRALFRAQHRGTKEMDWLIGRFAAARLPDMPVDDLGDFERLIAISDVELQSWLLQPKAIINREFAPQIAAIRAFHDLPAVAQA